MRRAPPVAPCEECGALTTHTFRSADDLIDALRVAAQEMDRGVLCRDEPAAHLGSAAEEALGSVRDSGTLPGAVAYRFRCTVCGQRFTLAGDTGSGAGGWTREIP